jgi:hypothetical protein
MTFGVTKTKDLTVYRSKQEQDDQPSVHQGKSRSSSALGFFRAKRYMRLYFQIQKADSMMKQRVNLRVKVNAAETL